MTYSVRIKTENNFEYTATMSARNPVRAIIEVKKWWKDNHHNDYIGEIVKIIFVKEF